MVIIILKRSCKGAPLPYPFKYGIPKIYLFGIHLKILLTPMQNRDKRQNAESNQMNEELRRTESNAI